ncbi:hypothetical protein ACFVVM_22250 [Nocardia sp. NPDC058176]|uniref:hypothetical protein n=1 Tax=Nocardia sp. NPDC058176 TaxID=3346368 RepID=UPI0036D7868D
MTKQVVVPRYYHRPNREIAIQVHPPSSYTAEPNLYPRPWTSPGDAAIRLRRCRQPLPHTGQHWQKRGYELHAAPLELEIDHPLPELCSRHGEPAVGRRPVEAIFYETRAHPRFHLPHPGERREDFSRADWNRAAPVSTILVGEWPVCAQCMHSATRYRRVVRALWTALAIIAVPTILIAVLGGRGYQWPTELSLLFCPAVFIVPILVRLFVGQQEEPVKFRPIYDERFVFVEAEPRFRAAVAQSWHRRPPWPG